MSETGLRRLAAVAIGLVAAAAKRAAERMRAEGRKPGPKGTPDVKREAIVALRREGMSPEKIAVAVEVSFSTVVRVLRQARDQG